MQTCSFACSRINHIKTAYGERLNIQEGVQTMDSLEITQPYYVQIKIEGCNSVFYGEGQTLDEAIHCALYALPDAQIRTLQVWTLASSE